MSEERGAYFLSPSADIQNILARVTGNNPSEILGRLGTFGSSNPNLFLINPNGIVLGKDASLDVQGSFVGTTANGIQFGNQGVFSAINPEAVPLLTIDPSALLFNQINQNAAIASQSRLGNGGGLFASPSKSLLLVGGNVILDGTQMGVRGGSIEIGSVSGSGSVELISNGNGLQLGFSEAVPRSDVVLQNNAQIFAIANGDFGGGNIAIYARNLDVRGDSLIRGGILAGLLTKPDTQAGDIILNATGTVRVKEESQITNVVDTGALGNAGDIRITAASLFLSDNAQLKTTTFGQGNGGDLLIEAADRVSLDMGADIFAEVKGTGNGGNIRINTASFSATNGAGLSNSIYGKGNAGDIVINAGDDRISLGQNVRVNNGIQDTGDGIGGNISFNTGSLFITDNAAVNTFTAAKGNAGDIIFDARDLVSLDSNAQVNSFAVDSNGGNVRISTGNLYAKNDALLEVNTFGRGNAGNVQIEAKDSISFDDAGILNIAQGTTGNAGNIFLTAGNLISLNNRAGIANQVRQGSDGAGGDIRINTGSLTLTNISVIQAITGGRGNAGNVVINARDRILVRDGISSDKQRSRIQSGVNFGAIANGGNVEINSRGIFGIESRTKPTEKKVCLV
ncbi:two-partner secretion domain-containing protein [Nostoc sp.]|uniref:two-partner secretion domain-containing protein n=1 Tax=Nostoc sp. TaxID=1180 RepID=UPI003FA59620